MGGNDDISTPTDVFSSRVIGTKKKKMQSRGKGGKRQEAKYVQFWDTRKRKVVEDEVGLAQVRAIPRSLTV